MMAAIARVVELAQRAAQGLDLVLVGVLLTLGQFERFQHALHLVEGFPQGLDDLRYLFDGLLDGSRFCRTTFAGSVNFGFGRRRWGRELGRRRSFLSLDCGLFVEGLCWRGFA